MGGTLLYRSRNVYEQQSHNRRMTVVFILLFIVFFLAVGIGFDIFYGASRAKLIFIVPLLVLTFAPVLWNAQGKYASTLWNDKTEIKEYQYEWAMLKLVIGSLAFLTLFFIYFLWSREKLWGNRPTGVTLYFDYVMKFLDEPFLRIMPWGTALTIVMVAFIVVTSLRWGPMSIVWSVNNTDAEQFPDQYKLLQNVIKEISLAAGITPPQAMIIKDADPNAFAIGTRPEKSFVVVTSGMLSVLNREELQGVVAHEISHIKNKDTLVMTVVTVLFGGLLLLAEWMRKVIFWNTPIAPRVPGISIIIKTVLLIFWILAVIFAPVIAKILAMSVSRQREYLADASAVELTRNPLALASALSKIETQSEPTRSVPKSIAHFCIIDPLERKINNKEGFWANLLATHPPTQKRIMFLRSMAYQSSIISK